MAAQPRLIVSRSALTYNVDRLRALAGPEHAFCAVVKADAYGHGATGVVEALFNPLDRATPLADALAVATIAEAMALPEVDAPIMVLRPVELAYAGGNRRELEDALRRGLLLSVVTPAAVDDVARAAERAGVRGEVQVMLDTGMHREMCRPEEFASVVSAVRRHPSLRLAGVGTHLTDGELPDEPFNDEQVRLLHDAIELLGEPLPPRILRHAANSGGTFAQLDADDGAGDFNMVRCGLSLYGVAPSCRPGDAEGLRPVARWVAPLLLVRDVAVGESVGYGRTWRAQRPTRVGVIPVGYADGYRRALSNAAVVRIDGPAGEPGALCPVVGRVSMDYVTVDLSPAPWASPGDDVTLLDDDPASPCSAAALAELAATIPYEIFTGLGNRIARQVAE